MADTIENKITEEKSGIRVIKFDAGVDKRAIERIASGRMNAMEYYKLANAALGNGVYTEEPKKNRMGK